MATHASHYLLASSPSFYFHSSKSQLSSSVTLLNRSASVWTCPPPTPMWFRANASRPLASVAESSTRPNRPPTAASAEHLPSQAPRVSFPRTLSTSRVPSCSVKSLEKPFLSISSVQASWDSTALWDSLMTKTEGLETPTPVVSLWFAISWRTAILTSPSLRSTWVHSVPMRPQESSPSAGWSTDGSVASCRGTM